MSDKVTVIGAGLAGSLLSIYLAKRGIEVDVYEAAGDVRNEKVVAGRSINLALSDRGIAALREAGMAEVMLAEAVPMYGRMIHSPDGETKLLPYSGRKGEYINSISRAGLNVALITEAERYSGVRFHFRKRCVDLDIEKKTIALDGGETVKAAIVIATDGAGSAVRQAMQRREPGFQAFSTFLEHGYKELHIPPGEGGGFLLEKNALHIWPRHQFMMIALPNWDGSFTCTLFLARVGGDAAFDRLTDEASVLSFFEKEFPDALPLMPTLVEDFFSNPTGELGTLRCWPWNVGGEVLLLGDAAHAMVPFYGQGMNCAFEDVRVLASLIDGSGAPQERSINWADIFEQFAKRRKPNADAIQDMALDNFYEMRDRVADPVFQRKRAVETRLEQEYPDYFSRYSMVTFREDMPYSEAMRRGNAQDAFLMEYCRDSDDASGIDIRELHQKLRSEVE